MSAASKPVKGSVRLLVCKVCDNRFPTFDYEVESDADAIGLYSAGLCGGTDLILMELDFEEWKAAQSGELHHIPPRLGAEIANGYLVTHVLRVEGPPLPPAGTSFSEFRKQYKAPTVIYSCPCCESGEANTLAEITTEEFIRSGGKLRALPPLNLVS
jgi:hypothetical protein